MMMIAKMMIIYTDDNNSGNGTEHNDCYEVKVKVEC